MTLVPDLADMVERFQREILDYPIPDTPTKLMPTRKNWALIALREELDEFEASEKLEDEADALIDFTYFALGRLIEMGIAPRALFEEVHAANMKKVRGSLEKRPGSLGYDAIKPKGWRAPDLKPYLTANREDLKLLNRAKNKTPRIIVMGHARHGKDTVCEILRDSHGLSFQSASMIAADHIMFPLLKDKYGYKTVRACFDDRENHRAEWYEGIRDFNRPDATSLAQVIFDESDIYCGLRHEEEYAAIMEAGMADMVIWVDASKRCPMEDASSITVKSSMADIVVTNNGTVSELKFQINMIMERFLGEVANAT